MRPVFPMPDRTHRKKHPYPGIYPFQLPKQTLIKPDNLRYRQTKTFKITFWKSMAISNHAPALQMAIDPRGTESNQKHIRPPELFCPPVDSGVHLLQTHFPFRSGKTAMMPPTHPFSFMPYQFIRCHHPFIHQPLQHLRHRLRIIDNPARIAIYGKTVLH